MKHISVFVLLLVVFCVSSNAQPLQAHAGADTAVCPNPPSGNTQPRIGLPATGGAVPYTYLWTGYANASGNYTALLDSPTIAQPHVTGQVSSNIDSVYFALQVTDGAGSIARDTVKVMFSRWGCILADCIRFKTPGDTVSIFAACGSTNFYPTKMEWMPNIYLDSTISAVTGYVDYRSFTPTTWNYTVIGTDRAGCRRPAGSCSIVVTPTRLPEVVSLKSTVRIIPSLVTHDSRIEISPDLLGSEMRIFSVDGRAVRTMSLHVENTKLSAASALPPGHYFYRIVCRGAPPLSGHFAVQE